MISICCRNHVFAPIQAIVFDKDGTLAHSEPYLSRLAQRRAALISAQLSGIEHMLHPVFGIEQDRLNPAGLMAVGTRLENEIAAAACVASTGIPWVTARQLVQTAFQQADAENGRKVEQTPLIPGATALIQQLARSGVKLAILSSDRDTEVQQFVQQFGLTPYFQMARGVTEQFADKSDPALLAEIFQQLDVQPAQTLMIGDSLLDAQIAQQFGMAGCIGVLGGWSLPVAIEAATVTIERFDQVIATVAGLPAHHAPNC